MSKLFPFLSTPRKVHALQALTGISDNFGSGAEAVGRLNEAQMLVALRDYSNTKLRQNSPLKNQIDSALKEFLISRPRIPHKNEAKSTLEPPVEVIEPLPREQFREHVDAQLQEMDEDYATPAPLMDDLMGPPEQTLVEKAKDEEDDTVILGESELSTDAEANVESLASVSDDALLKHELKDRELTIESLKVLLAEKDNQIARQAAVIEEKDNQIAQQATVIEAKDTMISGLRHALDTVKQEVQGIVVSVGKLWPSVSAAFRGVIGDTKERVEARRFRHSVREEFENKTGDIYAQVEELDKRIQSLPNMRDNLDNLSGDMGGLHRGAAPTVGSAPLAPSEDQIPGMAPPPPPPPGPPPPVVKGKPLDLKGKKLKGQGNLGDNPQGMVNKVGALGERVRSGGVNMMDELAKKAKEVKARLDKKPIEIESKKTARPDSGGIASAIALAMKNRRGGLKGRDKDEDENEKRSSGFDDEPNIPEKK